MAKNIARLIGIVCFLVLGSGNAPRVSKFRVKTIVLDAGHGGYDPGACGKFSKEKDISLQIALKLGKAIKENMPGVKVVFTRTKDVFKTVGHRGRIANKNNAQVFVSIHCNASKDKKAHGVEAFVIGLSSNPYNLRVAQRENSVILLEKDYKTTYQGFDPKKPESHILFSLSQNAYNDNSVKLAQAIQRQFEGAKIAWRGIKQSPIIALSRASKAVARLLIEAGFITNEEEEKYLNSKLGQQKIVHCLLCGLKEYKRRLEA